MKRKVRDALGLLAPLGFVNPRIHPNYVPPSAKISKQWRAKFCALKRFAKREGHSRVPQSYGTAKHPTLGVWVSNQRQAYRHERFRKAGLCVPDCRVRMNNKKVALLNSVDFEWEAGRSQALHRWRDKFALLQRFFRKHQHSRVPYSLNTDEYPAVGVWVRNQRQAYRNEQQRLAGDKPKERRRLNKWQRAKLRSVVFEYDVREAVWEEKFAMLKDFELWEGNTRVPESLDSDRYPKLGLWVARQRNAYRNEKRIAKGEKVATTSRITKEHIARLESLGFEWEVRGKPIPKIDPSQFEGMII